MGPREELSLPRRIEDPNQTGQTFGGDNQIIQMTTHHDDDSRTNLARGGVVVVFGSMIWFVH